MHFSSSYKQAYILCEKGVLKLDLSTDGKQVW